jgi:hypothetical protein
MKVEISLPVFQDRMSSTYTNVNNSKLANRISSNQHDLELVYLRIHSNRVHCSVYSVRERLEFNGRIALIKGLIV